MPVNGVRMGDWVQDVDAHLSTVAYTTGDVFFDAQEIEYATMDNGSSVLQSIVLTDYDDNGVAIDLLFFRSAVSIGTANVAVSISESAATECIGGVSVGVAKYIDLGTRQVATLTSVGLEVHPTNGKSIWVAAVIRESQTTYASGKMLFKFGFLRG